MFSRYFGGSSHKIKMLIQEFFTDFVIFMHFTFDSQFL